MAHLLRNGMVIIIILRYFSLFFSKFSLNFKLYFCCCYFESRIENLIEKEYLERDKVDRYDNLNSTQFIQCPVWGFSHFSLVSIFFCFQENLSLLGIVIFTVVFLIIFLLFDVMIFRQLSLVTFRLNRTHVHFIL